MMKLRTYEGLLHNHAELATELDVNIDDMTRHQREETLMLAAYNTWGTDMGSHINGQFALVMEDDESGELFATRDILGAELLFYYETNPGSADNRLLIATQISDFFDQPDFVRELNRDAIQFYLAFNYVPGEMTLFKGVRKVEPGGYLTFGGSGNMSAGNIASAANGSNTPADNTNTSADNNDNAHTLTLGRYWELSFEPDESKTVDQWADEIDTAMEASLASICDADEMPCSFLSSGVDSSYILAKSNARTGYCVSYENTNMSEDADAQATAKRLGRGFEGITITPQDFFANVDDFLLAFEQPTADVAGLSLFAACKHVSQKTPLCFSGEGADEFFAGYGVYGKAKRYKTLPFLTYFGSTYIMKEHEQRRYVKHYNAGATTTQFMKDRCGAAKKYDTLTWMLYTDMRSYFEGSILFNSTKIARGTGLDIRMPFCDLRMFDIARRMPSRFKHSDKGNKIALRKAASRVLPKEVAYRKKLGFPVPIRQWLADPAYNAEIRRAFESEAAAEFFNVDELRILLDTFLGAKPAKHKLWFKRRPALLWRYVWTIYLFIRWYELFF